MNALEQTRPQEAFAPAQDNEFDRLLQKTFSPTDLLLDDTSFDRIIRIAELMADGKTSVPKHLQGNVGDCAAVVTQAFQWGMNPFAVAQKTHVVNGALGYEAQLVNAVVQQSGAIRGHFHYEFEGEGQSLICRVGAMLRGDSVTTWGEWLSVNAPKTKNSPLWATNPKQQLGYLQVKNWARSYAPGAILGVYTPDELDDIPGGPASAPSGPRRKSEKTEAAAPAAAPRPDPETGEVPAPPAQTPVQAPAAAAPKTAAPGAAAPQGGISGGQVAYLRNKLKAAGVTEQTISDRFQVTSIELLNAEQFDEVKTELLSMG